jgi:hypothetical protein
MDLVDLAKRAQRLSVETERQEAGLAAEIPSLDLNLTSLKAVRTPLDSQVAQHRKLDIEMKRKKAVGDDTFLDIDVKKIGQLKTRQTGVTLFDTE